MTAKGHGTGALDKALDEAIGGRRAGLYALLERGSRLPGTRANDALADAFGQACRARGVRADELALAMARLDADEAPGASAKEFLPVCGLAALGARAAVDGGVRAVFLAELHAHADDLRFRVRGAVVDALVRVGSALGDALVAEVAPFMDGYFHAAAVLTAASREPWLTAIHDADGLLHRLDQGFALVREAPRAAARYPGRKALMDALLIAPVAAALRFGVPTFDLFSRWANASDPELRALVETLVSERRLEARFGAEAERVRAALRASAPPVRNPDHDHGPSRDRSGARRRGKR